MVNSASGPCDDGIILSRAAFDDCDRPRGRWILVATILASSMAFIDGTVVNVALPSLQKNLHATAADVQWVVEAYSLFLSALLLVGGSLGDRYGRRRVFVLGVAVFAVSSAMCGFSGTIDELIISRAVQGIGGALLVPGSLAIISSAFRPDDRGKAIGTWSGFSAMTTAIGPVLGGWLVERVSWRAVFFLNLPIAVAVVLISLARVPESRDREQRGPLDWVGAALATIALGGLVYGLIHSSQLGFSNPVVLSALVVGTISLVLFVVNESRAANPMMPLALFRLREFAGANLLTLLLYAGLGGTFFFLALNLIQVQGYSATAAGGVMLPFVMIMFLLSRWSGGLIARCGARLPLIIGPAIVSLGFLLFALPGVSNNYWTSFFPAMLVLGVGMAISVAPLTTTVMTSAGEAQSGVASGINNAVARTAGLLAIAVFGVLMLQVFSRALDHGLTDAGLSDNQKQTITQQSNKLGAIEMPETLDDPRRSQVHDVIRESFVSGFRLVMLTAASLAIGAALSSAIMIGKSVDREALQRAKSSRPS